MKLIVKTLNGKQLPIEIEPETSIGEIKEQIEKDHQLKADSLKLIAYGKVLQSDDQKASEYNLKEGDFIVAMVQKAKPAPKPKKEEKKEEEKPPAATSQPAAASSAAATASASASQPASSQPAGQPAATTSAASASTAQLPPEVESAVSELMAISGKPRELCIQALMAANNIPDVAFEFLMSGNIPEAPADDGAEGDMYGEEGDDMGAGAGGLAQYNLSPETLQAIQALSSNPSFPMIRQRMLQDPNFSQQFMAQLQQTQPQIFNAIQANPGILMSLILGHDPMQGLGPGGGAGGAGAAGAGAAGAGAGAGRARPPPGSIQVTPEEMASIDRLVSLGFSKARAAEAFFACDKNEEMAANFLFENGIEDEEQAMQAAMQASAQQQPGSANAASGEANQASSEANPASSEANPAAVNDQNVEMAEPEKKDDDKKDGEGGDGAAGGGAGPGDGSSLA